eukprot:scaffold1.g5471.t1
MSAPLRSSLQDDPAKDPVVLWLNGGPGCSSFDGFVYEHGPFRMSFQGGKEAEGQRRQVLQLEDNPHSWSTAASVLYVDSPAGVGMSYSETKEDYHTNDTQTAADMDAFLRRWFELWPELQGNDFFVSGESYAGVYVPLVAQAVVRGNARGQAPRHQRINIRGYIVGNGVTDQWFDGNSFVPFAAGKSLISEALFEKANRHCGGKFWDPEQGSECERLLGEVYKAVAGINIYNILENCYHGRNPYTGDDDSSVTASPASSGSGSPGSLPPDALAAAVASRRGWPLLGGVRPGAVPGFTEALGLGANGSGMLGHTPPCLDSREMWAFANDPAVREALHAEPISTIGPFRECVNGEVIQYTHNEGSMLPVHADLMRAGLRALVFSGDHDMAVPHTGTEAWTAAFAAGEGMEEVRGWGPWHAGDHQVAGYSIRYRRGAAELTYATVKGAGHMVPETKPAEALAMFSRFITTGRLHPEEEA